MKSIYLEFPTLSLAYLMSSFIIDSKLMNPCGTVRKRHSLRVNLVFPMAEHVNFHLVGQISSKLGVKQIS